MDNPGCEAIVKAPSAILVLTPHTGTQVPESLHRHQAWRPVQGRIVDPAGMMLQAAARRVGASLITARFNPCFIDFNVCADRRELLPGFGHQRLCRTATARGEALYDSGGELTHDEVERRVDAYWRPFHDTVGAELQRLKQLHANVLLLVSHASWWLSPYRAQPGARDCNIGTHGGRSCDPQLVSALTQSVHAHGCSWIVNGQMADAFAAGHYGAPQEGLHAIELEVAGRLRVECMTQCMAPASGAEAARVFDNDRVFDALLHALETALQRLPAPRALTPT